MLASSAGHRISFSFNILAGWGDLQLDINSILCHIYHRIHAFNCYSNSIMQFNNDSRIVKYSIIIVSKYSRLNAGLMPMFPYILLTYHYLYLTACNINSVIFEMLLILYLYIQFNLMSRL